MRKHYPVWVGHLKVEAEGCCLGAGRRLAGLLLLQLFLLLLFLLLLFLLLLFLLLQPLLLLLFSHRWLR